MKGSKVVNEEKTGRCEGNFDVSVKVSPLLQFLSGCYLFLLLSLVWHVTHLTFCLHLCLSVSVCNRPPVVLLPPSLAIIPTRRHIHFITD